ncbi:glutaredoxin [Dissophora ornata]|nr:hypothetical protein BGZ58_010964 [Dissophora ornata]KAI8594741.1 glutaredoxin [Dissophora ornata]
MAANLKTEIDNIIASNAVVVFSKTHCPYCTKAKNLLVQKGVKAYIVELDTVENGAAIQAYLLELTGQRTVPNIFIGQKHIGGCDALYALESSDKLDDLLAKI